ncbi:MAG: DEAD/DEAH box helicase [Saprospiraceae bacterium]|nr:DEAD/DEAH box helicase [Saprospiraceae bacterium]
MKFKELGLDDQILEAIGYMGFEEATPIQEKAIPVIIEGKDLIACAQTGTGKTAAFILPTLHRIYRDTKGSGTRALVVCPTRELALQIEKQIQGFAYFLGIHSIAIYGGGSGSDFEQQKKALKSGADIIVATPGKLLSHLNLGYVKFDTVQHFILDESDRMMDMGFREDIDKIASFLPKDKQTLMFSATMPPKIREMSKQLLRDPEQISFAISKPAEGVLQAVYLAHDAQKIPLLTKLIADKPSYESIIIFTSTKKNVSNIVLGLRKNKFAAEGISSDYDQSQREAVLSSFKHKKTRIIVATDVLSRGIDIKDINLVINFDVPRNAEDYVHRVGRTARAKTTGVAITLINEKDMYNFHQIEQLIEREIMKLPPPPELGEGPEWRVGRKKGGNRRNYGNKNRKKSNYRKGGKGKGNWKGKNNKKDA